MIPVVIFVGDSNSGKTYCIERIIPRLKEKGFKIGVIKHAPHGFKLDYEKRDSYRMSQAGADTVVIASPDRVGMIKKIHKEFDVDSLRKYLFKDVDLLIVEGYKLEDFPKIAVFKGDIIYKELKEYRQKLIACLCNSELDDIDLDLIDVPCFKKDNIEKISSFIIKRVIRKRRKNRGAKKNTI